MKQYVFRAISFFIIATILVGCGQKRKRISSAESVIVLKLIKLDGSERCFSYNEGEEKPFAMPSCLEVVPDYVVNESDE